MFIKEMHLYIDYLKEQLEESITEELSKRKKYFSSFYQNLREGISYYLELHGIAGRRQFVKALLNAGSELDHLNERYELSLQLMETNHK